ncbi:MAG: hypothetical protein M9944_04095 [Rhizobiaceae bacterium]|nr:hypothetical protein [Rhizobiaceae bacterium]
MDELAELIGANATVAKAIAAAYELGLGGVPTQAGFTFLINNAVATNFGSNNPSIVFNDENVYINVINALVQGNADAAASFAAMTAGASSLTDKIAAFYNQLVPASAQSAEGLAYLTRPEALDFYMQVAAERGVAGPDGAAIVALASMVNVFVRTDLSGIGDTVNDFYSAVLDGSAVLPADGNVFTPLETADGTNYDGDDGVFGQVTLTEGTDIVSGTIFDAPRGFTPGGTDQVNTLNTDDVLTGTSDDDVLNVTYVANADIGDNDIQPTLNDIETVNVNVQVPFDAYLDLQDATGVETIALTGIDDAYFGVYNIQDAKGKGDAGINLSVTNSNDEYSAAGFNFVDKALAGAMDIANVTVSNVTLNYLAVTGSGSEGFETINLESSGASNIVRQIEAEDLQTANITGDQELTLGSKDDTIRSSGQVEGFRYGAGFSDVAGSLSVIDASGLDAALDIAVGGEAVASKDGTSGTPVDISITGTKFDDTIRLLSGIDGKGDTVAGGEGDDTVQVFASVTKGTLTGLEHLDIRGGQDLGTVADTIKVDTSLFDGLKDITIRNEGQDFVGVNWISSPEALTTNLTNLTADLAKAITIQHSTTGSNGLLQNTIVAQLKTDTAADTVALTIVDQSDGEDRGINIDPRFNIQLQTAGVENITINDNDSESNTVRLGAGAIATDTKGGGLTDITGTLTLTGGVAGTFMNFDTQQSSGFGPAFAGTYDLDVSGQALDPSAQSPFKAAGGVGSTANVLDSNGNPMDWFSGAKFDGSTYLGDIVLRVDTLRNADGAAQPGGGQTLLFGSGNDTVIFDLRNDLTAGLTISDTVKAGDGNDTILFDGENARLVLGSSEWTNVSGFENIRLVGNGVAAADLNLNGDATEYGENSQNILLTNDMIDRNGVDIAGGRSINIINDNDLTDGVGTTGTGLGFANMGVTIDARGLDASHSFSFNGAEGGPIVTDRFIMADANINGLAVIDGGMVLGGGNAASNKASADILEVRDSAVVTIGDLANVSNVGHIWFTNDTAAVQTSVLQLDDATVDRLVNTSQAAGAATGVETLTIRAIDNPILPAATTQLNLDASQVTSAFLALNVTGGGGTDTITTGAGDDIINGGGDRDIINGGGGNDIITGSLGFDLLTGGAGADIFDFNPGTPLGIEAPASGTIAAALALTTTALANATTAFEVITDFMANVDKIDLRGFNLDSFGTGAAVANGGAIGVDILAVQVGANTVLQIDANESGVYFDNTGTDMLIVLTGVTATDLDINDFILV